jgi:3-hydroxyacyl-CoA dehydrogenase
MKHIRTAAVLGAGTMGAQIAAHLANAGVPTLLLDVTAEAAAQGLTRARALKPDPFHTRDTATLIRTGGLDDLSGLRGCDWVLEAVVERLDIKQALMERVERQTGDSTIVSSNTSGIPIATIAEGRSPGFKRRWLGTHFFNPPRYLALLEVIATADTDPAVVRTIVEFADRRLGKGVVLAKDTPGFIANRIGIFGLMQVFKAMSAAGLSVEDVDALTGPAIGRPKSATFRTMDLAGVDLLAAVARDLGQRLDPVEQPAFAVPPVVDELVRRGWTGSKAGRGFYQKQASGEIEALDFALMEYRPSSRPRFPAIDAARTIEDPAERIRTLFKDQGKVGGFLRTTLAPTILYAATIVDRVAESPGDIDRAMRWGFGWDAGPFETLRAIGVEPVVDALGEAGTPENRALLAAAAGTNEASAPSRLTLLTAARTGGRVLRKNAGASLVDLGDGVLCLEFHSKMNAIGGDTIEMVRLAVKEAGANFAALVVGNDALHFSAGANLMLLLLEAQEGNWDDVDMMVRAFQGATAALRYADVPVVAAPAGLTLGGGCEITLHADRVQAAAEAYIGLVEAGVGLIPAGGGTKEMLARAMDGLAAGAEPLPFIQRAFETIGFATVSASGPDARRLGFLRAGDAISMNRDRLLADAKAVALARVTTYAPPQPRKVPVGGPSVFAALKLGVHLAWRAGRISDHDAVIGRKLAWILSGGNVAAATTLTEQQLLDLEREAFLSLCGERKTQERIAHTLKTGKPLRN